MNKSPAWRVAVAAALISAACGCSSSPKSSGKPAAALRIPTIPLLSKDDDQSLRKAVEKDPFPRAQGSLAAKTPGP